MDGAIYSLCAINLCEVAGWKLTPPDVAVRIYATAALRFKMQLPPFMRLCSVTFVSKDIVYITWDKLILTVDLLNIFYRLNALVYKNKVYKHGNVSRGCIKMSWNFF